MKCHIKDGDLVTTSPTVDCNVTILRSNTLRFRTETRKQGNGRLYNNNNLQVT